MKAGKYSVEANGIGHKLGLEVTIFNDKIEKFGPQYELGELEHGVLSHLSKRIIDNQSVEVDSVTGASVSSQGIKDATIDAIKQAGGNPEDFKKNCRTNKNYRVQKEQISEPDYSQWLKSPEKVEQVLNTDLVIIGGGISGLSASVQASDSKVKTILLEKNGFLGGNGTGVEGLMGAGSKMQKEAGINFTKSEVVKNELETINYQADGSFWVDIVNNSAENIEWLQKHGVQFDKVDDYHGTCPLPCFHWFKGGRGAIGYIPAMAKTVYDSDSVTVYTESPATGLIFDKSEKRVKGVYANIQGVPTQINAKAVIFASGGFGQNKELIKKQGWNTEHMITIGMPSSVGDAYHMAMAAGAMDKISDSAPLITNQIQALPVSNGRDLIAGGPALWVNQDGVRFTDESIVERNAILQSQPLKSVKVAYTVFNGKLFDEFESNLQDLDDDQQGSMSGIDKFGVDNLNTARRVLEKGVKENKGNSLFKADTLEELAGKVGLPVDYFVAQVKRYNKFCKNGVDEEFAKHKEDLVAIEGGPYYIARLDVSYGVSIGGIGENRHFEVIDDNYEKINGLYAAGIDSAMQYRKIYTINLGGSCCAHNVNSGRHAVINAKKYMESL